MLISKFDLHRNEWLELVFANRNKEYGAYELRQHSADTTVKAMGITFLSITAAFIAGSILLKTSNTVSASLKPDVVTITEVITVTPPKKEEVKQPESAPPAKTTKFLVPVVTAGPVTETAPDVTKIVGAVGPVTNEDPGSIIIDNIPEPVGTGKGEAEVAPKPEIIYTKSGVDVMPEPDGGAAGWTKFLERNLRYPTIATEAGKSGKVWVSFIVEKDGQISNVMVDRGAGYGMDEEALRVLKLSKKWKPGKQNGEPVRVKYTLPLNFVLTE
jgi:periplasmic protein TonB